MNGFDQLERELEAAARRKGARSWSRRAGGAGGAVAIAASLATVVVIAVGAVALLHGRGASTPAAAPASQGAPGAQVAAWEKLLTCSRAPAPKLIGRPAVTNASPDPRLVAALGVLRGPWTAADEAPAGNCELAAPLLPLARIDVRFVRYVGAGLHGGSVYLVPGTTGLPLLPPGHKAAARKLLGRLYRQPVACLITIGGKSSPGPQTCAPLPIIERPAGFAIGLPTRFPEPSLRVSRLACTRLKKLLHRVSGARGIPAPIAAPACLRSIHAPQRPVLLAPEVMSGVVRDGITSLSVYTRAGKRLLTVPIHNNVYMFQTGGAVSGELKLVFTNAGGQVVRGTPSAAGSVTAIAVPPAAGVLGVANIPPLGNPIKTKTGTVLHISPAPAKPRRARRSSSG